MGGPLVDASDADAFAWPSATNEFQWDQAQTAMDG